MSGELVVAHESTPPVVAAAAAGAAGAALLLLLLLLSCPCVGLARARASRILPARGTRVAARLSSRRGARPPAPGSLFAGYQIPRRVEVAWGQWSVAEAERRLLAAALADPRNQRFVLLSETCAPLHPPQLLYMQLLRWAQFR
eukprot:scaffold8.g1689.t1